MRKALKFIIPGICILVVVITFYMIFDMQEKVEQENYGVENISDKEENITDTEIYKVDNTVNKTSENTIEDSKVLSDEEDNFSSKKAKSAIDLVKEYWGEDSTVYFTNEGVNSKGEHIVAVRQKTSTIVKNYFKVNLETQEIELDY